MIVNSLRPVCFIHPGYGGVSSKHQNPGGTTTQTKPHVLVGATGNDRNSVVPKMSIQVRLLCVTKGGEDKLISKKMMPLSGNNFQYSTECLLQSFKNMNKGLQKLHEVWRLALEEWLLAFFLSHVGET